MKSTAAWRGGNDHRNTDASDGYERVGPLQQSAHERNESQDLDADQVERLRPTQNQIEEMAAKRRTVIYFCRRVPKPASRSQ